MKITILGGGNGSHAAAGHMTDLGHDVTLWRRELASFQGSMADGTLKLTDWQGDRTLKLNRITSDLEAAIFGADVVILPLPCTSHVDLAPRLAPLWQEGQVAYLPPGTFGSWILAKAKADAGNSADVSFCETGTLPYLARMQAPDHVRISVYATRLPTGVFPARNREQALARLQEIYPVEPLVDVLDGALMNAGPIIHPPLIMMNAGPLEHFDAWDIHNEGTQPSIRRVTDALDQERIALREALGYGAPHFPLADHYDDARPEWMYGNSSHDRLTDSGDWREHIDLISHRYMTEDSELGLAFLTSLGQRKHVAMPIANGFLAIASAITGTDPAGHSHAADNLGLTDLADPALQDILQNGFSS